MEIETRRKLEQDDEGKQVAYTRDLDANTKASVQVGGRAREQTGRKASELASRLAVAQ